MITSNSVLSRQITLFYEKYNLISRIFFCRSHEQQHYFNTPFQLSLPPSNMAADVLSDAPESADQYEFSVEDGDVIMLATDGVFDNIPDSILVEEIGILQNGPLDAAKIQVIVCMENNFFPSLHN